MSSTGARTRFIPREHRHGMLRRLLIVLAVALLIGAVNWAMRPASGPVRHGLDQAMVYSLAISLLTWLFRRRRPLRAVAGVEVDAADYWPPPMRASMLLVGGICAGYLLGTALGDAYAGTSTWEMLQLNPNRFTGLLVSSLAISVAFIVYFHQRGHNEALARQAREAQLQLLQSQLEPHMLFNTLANLRVLIGMDPPRAQAMLDRLIAFLRATLSASRNATQPLSAEFERIGDYLALMGIRMGPRLQTQLFLTSFNSLQLPSTLFNLNSIIFHGINASLRYLS